MSKLFKLALLLVLAFSTLQADTKLQSIVDDGELVVGTSGNMSPMTRAIDDGKTAVGFDMDLAQTMAKSLGVELVIKVIPFEKLIPALQDGDIDLIISNMTITPERNAQVAFAGPYFISGKCLVTKKAALANAKKEELNDTKNKMVVLRGTTDEKFVNVVMPNVKVTLVDTQEEAVTMVRELKVSALLTEFPICKSVITSNPNDNFVSVFSKLTYEPIGVAVAPENTHLLNWTQNFLTRAKDVGLTEVLATKWFK